MRIQTKEELKKDLTSLFNCYVTHYEPSPQAGWWIYFRLGRATVRRLNLKYGQSRFLEHLGDDEYRISTEFKPKVD